MVSICAKSSAHLTPHVHRCTARGSKSGTTSSSPGSSESTYPPGRWQARQYSSRRARLTNCEAVLHTASATLSDVVEVGVLLHDYDDFAGMNEEWTAWFPVDHRRAPSPNWVPSSLASSSHPDDCDPRVDAARTRRAAAIDRRSLPAPALAGSLRYVAAQCTNNDAARHLAPGAASPRLYRFGRPLILSRRSPSRRQGGSR